MSVVYKKLEEVCEILDSQRIPITAKDRKVGQYPYYGANGLQDYVAEYIFDDELVLLAEDGGNFGSTDRPIAYRVSGKCWVNNHAHVLKAKPCIDIDYLGYSLMFYDTSGLVNGATRQKLTQAAMREMKIPYRNSDEQKEIVRKIDGVFSLIEKSHLELHHLDQLVKSRFVEMFGESSGNPKGWNTIQLGRLSDVGSSKRVFVEELQIDGIPFYRGTEVGALAEGQQITPELYITEQHYRALINATGAPVRGDLLMPSICSDGRIWLVDTDAPFYFKDGRVLWIHPTSCELDSCYLQHVLKEKIMTDYSSIASGTTFAELKIFALKELRVMMPPLELQQQFAAFVAEVDKSKLAVKQSLEKLETRKKSLMQQYFG